MTTNPLEQIPASWQPLRLATLIRLRWLAVAGQTLSILVVVAGLRFEVPLLGCFALISLSACLNIFLSLRLEAGMRLSNTLAALLLGFDSLQLGGLLWLTGGLENPFSLLLLAPVSVSATTLHPRATIVLSVFTVLIATGLALVHLPLPWREDGPFVADPLYVTGIWVSLLLGVVFISAYTNRVAQDARQLATALSATEMTLLRQQQLQALDGLAAAAAHELGTPLSTIALAAREMKDEVESGPLADDVQLIIEQVARCRTILAKLRSLGADDVSGPFAALPLGELVAEVAQPYERLGKSILYEAQPVAGPEPVFRRSAGLLYGIGNLIENAVHFAHEHVTIVMRWDAQTVRLTITDDGPGFAPDMIPRLGEPYLSSRPRSGGGDDGEHSVGLGLGIFIAKTLIERTGGRVSFANRRPEGHAQVDLRWMRADIG